MKLIRCISTTFVLALLLPAVASAGSELESAVKAAFEQKPSDPFDSFTPSFELFQHTFGVHGVEVVDKQKGQYTLAGKLTHLASNGIEDAIAYRIVKGINGDTIKAVTWQINGGEWTTLSEPVTTALSGYWTGRALTPEQQREQTRALESALEKAVDKTWQSAAEFLIAHLAVRGC